MRTPFTNPLIRSGAAISFTPLKPMVPDGMRIAALILGIGRATEATKLGESIRKVL
jgi:hypothetical protein